MSEPLDPRLVYARTAAGNGAAGRHDEALSVAARRLLVMIDGHRPLAALPAVTRPGELRALIDALLADGLIALSGIVDTLPAEGADTRESRLEAVKREVQGLVARELGPSGSVLEARLQDCVNLTVMRSVMREIVGQVRERAGDAAAARVSVAAQAAFSAGGETPGTAFSGNRRKRRGADPG